MTNPEASIALRRPAAVAILLLAMACSSSPTTPNVLDRDVSPTAGREQETAREERQDEGVRRNTRESPTTLGKGSGGNADRRGPKAQSSDSPNASRVGDSRGDTEDSGRSPTYVDIRRASIRDVGRSARLRMTFFGPVPTRMPDEATHVVVEFRLERGERDLSVSASADDEGWSAAIRGERYPPGVKIDGNAIVFTVPWRRLGGGPFRWSANSSWTHSGSMATEYSFDHAPEGPPKRYRR